MLLEEIKTRKINGDRRLELAELARGLSVTYAPHEKVYVVKVDSDHSLQVAADRVFLYQRGEHSDSGGYSGRDDPVLGANNQLAAAIVEDLLKKVVVGSVPLNPVGTQRGRLFLDGEMCTPCRICGANEAAVRVTVLETCEDLRFLGDFKVFACGSCQNMFTHPVPHEALCRGPSDKPLVGLESRLLRWSMRRRVKRLQSLTEGDSVLNFTSRASLFAQTMSWAGFTVTSVDPHLIRRQDNSKRGAILGSSCDESVSEKLHLESGTFDVVTGWHILEQLPDPCETLRLCFELLKPGGVLYLSVPNVAGLQAIVGSRRWAYLNVPHHVSHFSQNGLIKLLRQIGFQSPRLFNHGIEYEILGFHQTLLNMIGLSHNYLYNKQMKGRRIERDLLYPRWTKLVSRLNFLLLPVSLICSGLAVVLKRPCFVEVLVRKPLLED
jgi:SAM-dependent methyltransferase